jgi:diguanylate cyclase
MNMNEPPHSLAQNQAELARRALKTLAERRLIPTPETFSDVYHEIAGGRASSGTPAAALKEVLKDLVRTNRMASQEAAQVLEVAARHDWGGVRDQLEQALARRPGAVGASWPALAIALLKQADLLHANWTRARKIDAVVRVIEAAADHPEVALERLTRLMESWGPALASLAGREDGTPAGEGDGAHAAAVTIPARARGPDELPPRPVAPRAAPDPQLQANMQRAQAEADAWKQMALRAMQLVETSCGEGTAARQKLREYAVRLGQDVAATEVDQLLARFDETAAMIERQLAEQNKVHAGLQRLLGLLCDNMKSLTPDEAWLAGQLEPIRVLLAGPLSSSQLAQAEQTLAAVIAQQSGARRTLQEAKVALKEMLSTLIERIGSMNSSTGRFYEQVGSYQRELESASDLDTITRVIHGLMADTQLMRADIPVSYTHLTLPTKA